MSGLHQDPHKKKHCCCCVCYPEDRKSLIARHIGPVHWQPTDGYPSPRCDQALKEPTGIFTVTRERTLLTCPDCIALVAPQRHPHEHQWTRRRDGWQCSMCGVTEHTEAHP